MLEPATEAEILEKALNAFHETTGLDLQAERTQTKGPRRGNADAEVQLIGPGIAKRFRVEIKPAVNPNNLGVIAEQVARLPQPTMLATEYVNPNMAKRLKQINIFFLDMVGNVYLEVPGLFIYVQGQKPPAKRFTERPTRAFRQAGLKVMFALFCKQDLINAPYRTIAKAADVALGTLSWIFDDLKKLGYLLELGDRGRRLVQREQLLERWLAAYPEQLRLKLVVGRYAAPSEGWWKETHIQKHQAYWGGEVAAARLTGYLRPEDVTIYVRGLPGPLLAAHRLRRDDRGNVEVLKAFWDTDLDWADKEIVHPILTYADLLRTGEARNLEAAKQLYNAQIAQFVRED